MNLPSWAATAAMLMALAACGVDGPPLRPASDVPGVVVTDESPYGTGAGEGQP